MKIDELIELFPRYRLSKVSLLDVYNSMKEIKNGDIRDIIEYLDNKGIRVSKTTLYKYLHILVSYL